jgi:hypothetical protein
MLLIRRNFLKSCAALQRKGYRKGQVVRGFMKKTGMWILVADDQQPGNLDEQIRVIFSKLPRDLEIWRNLSLRFKMDLFCGFFMEATDEGLEISPESLRQLGERSITLGICMYAPIGKDE